MFVWRYGLFLTPYQRHNNENRIFFSKSQKIKALKILKNQLKNWFFNILSKKDVFSYKILLYCCNSR